MTKILDTRKTQMLLTVAACVFCIVCMVPGIISAHYQMISDDIYQVLNCRYPLQSTMSPLTAFIGYPLTLLTGKLLYFRYLSLALNYGAVICMTLWLVRRTPQRSALLIAGAGVSIWLAGLMPFRSWIFSWDSPSNLLLTLTLIAALSLGCRNTWRNLTLCALAAASATLARIPDAVVIPLLCPYIILTCRRSGCTLRQTCLRVGFFLLTSAVIVTGFITVMYGSPSAYIEAWKGAGLTHHSPSEIFSYLNVVTTTFDTLSRLLLLYLTFEFLSTRIHRPMLRIPLMILAAAFMWYLLKSHLNHFEIIYYTNSLMLAMFIGVCIYRRERGVHLALLAAAIIMYAATFGSNSSLLKLLIIPVMPLLFALLLPVWRRGMTIFIALFMVIVSYKTFVNFRHLGAYDMPLKDLVTFRHVEAYEGIHTEPQFVELAEAVNRDLEPYRRKGYKIKVLSTGFVRFRWEYMFDDRNPVLAHYWSYWPADAPVDEFRAYVSRVAHSPEPVAVLCTGDFFPGRQPRFREEDWMQLLDKRMHRVAASAPGYAIYINR